MPLLSAEELAPQANVALQALDKLVDCQPAILQQEETPAFLAAMAGNIKTLAKAGLDTDTLERLLKKLPKKDEEDEQHTTPSPP